MYGYKECPDLCQVKESAPPACLYSVAIHEVLWKNLLIAVSHIGGIMSQVYRGILYFTVPLQASSFFT